MLSPQRHEIGVHLTCALLIAATFASVDAGDGHTLGPVGTSRTANPPRPSRTPSASPTGITPRSQFVVRGQSPAPTYNTPFQPGTSPWITVATPRTAAASPQAIPTQYGTPAQGGTMAPGDPFLNPGVLNAPPGAMAPGFGDPFSFNGPGAWNPYIAGLVDGGNERVRGEAQLMLPLYQNGYSLLFADLRGQFDDSENIEGNFGLVYRIVEDPNWIKGLYAFYDRKRTAADNDFNQLTLGIEALSVFFEARANGYIPLDGGTAAPSATSLQLVGNSLVMQSGREQPYYGFDAEIGFLLYEWFGGASELRGFIGGYHFDTNESGFPNISGPRGRLELRSYDLPWFGADSRLTFGIDLQWDEVRDTQVAGIARVVIPLGYRAPVKNNRLQRRMLDRVVRDDDIVTQARATGPQEQVIDVLSNQVLNNISMADASDVAGGALNLGGGSTVFVDGSQGTIDINQAIGLANGQQLIGGGTLVQVQGATTGTLANYTVPGTRPTINGTNAAVDVVQLNNNSGSRGVDVTGGRFGFIGDTNQNGVLDAASNLLLIDNTTTNTASTGFVTTNFDAASRFMGNTATMSGNTGMSFFGTVAGTVSGNTSSQNPVDGFNWGNNAGQFTNNTATGNARHGFNFNGTNTGTISNNTASGNGTGAAAGHGFVVNTNSGLFVSNTSMGNGSGAGGGDGYSFTSNTALGNIMMNTATGNGAGAGGGDGFNFNNINAGTVSQNTSTGNGTGAAAGDGFFFNGGNSGTISNNIATGNAAGLVPATAGAGSGFVLNAPNTATGVVSGNIASGNTLDGFTLLGNNAGMITGNTASGNLVDGFFANGVTNTGTISNNIASGNGFTNGVPTLFPPNPVNQGDGFDNLVNAAGAIFSDNQAIGNAGFGFNNAVNNGTANNNTASGNLLGNATP